MKRMIVLFFLLPVFFAACSKKKQDIEKSLCIKGKIIGVESCSKMWVVQIVEGPKIGESWNQYNNVIELYDVPDDKKGRDEIYFTFRNKEKEDGEPRCIPFAPIPNYSNVKKTLLSLSETSCEFLNTF